MIMIDQVFASLVPHLNWVCIFLGFKWDSETYDYSLMAILTNKGNRKMLLVCGKNGRHREERFHKN